MGTVIDMKTRKEFVAPVVVPMPEKVTEEQRVEDFAVMCEDRIWANAIKIRAVQGLDRALRALGRIADEMRNAGNPNYQTTEKASE